MRVNATDFQNAFGKYLALVEKDEIIIVKNGKGVARLSHYSDPDHFYVYEEAKQYKTKRKISYEEYMALVESSEQRYELINGEIYLLASPDFHHQTAIAEIVGHFYNFFKGKPCRSLTAPFDVRLFGYATKFEENPNVVQPDIVVICDTDKVDEKRKYWGVPTLVVEVLSPSTRNKDLVAKYNLYLSSGVREYWLVDPENKQVNHFSFSENREVLSLTTCKAGESIESTVFPGLVIPIDVIFS
ncbi:MAG: type II toxin-antitoxin system prevent-host-death family antitoxin [Bacillota bacterium]